MIDELDRHNIPLMIFSAGVGNIIDICLQRKMGVVPRNVHIVSNMMLFDERGVSCGFSEPLIHTFCKDGSAIEKCHSLCKETTGRYNVLLLGDSLGDLHMADGYRPNGDNVTILKIGFLNRAFDTHYEKFLEGFDIVLVDDQTVDLPIHLIEKVTCHNAFIKN
ncbi:Putative cytosolic 5'-nucleotidase 3 [Toxocara canis]|nr:Putative cytosolic 5'-nucleotidase 3 [Toxocara canis]